MTAMAQLGSPQQPSPSTSRRLGEAADATSPPPTAVKSTTRHWRALRNALLSRSPPDTKARPVTASALSTEFFPVFPSHRCAPVLPSDDDSFEWVQYDLSLAPSSQRTSAVVTVRVREKKASARVTVAELLSHKTNGGVDNTGNVRMWPSEQLLLSYVLRNDVCQRLFQRRVSTTPALSPSPSPFNCCELGSGMAGLAGLGLVAHAPVPFARVDITDGNAQSVANLAFCVAANAAPKPPVQVHTKLLRWDRTAAFAASERHQFDLVLASDCLFFEDFHVDLAHTIHELLRPMTGECLLLQPSRNGSMERFVAVAERQGLTVERCDAFDPDVARKHVELVASRADYEPDVHLPVLLRVSTRSDV